MLLELLEWKYMKITTYDPAWWAKQVAFEEDLQEVIDGIYELQDKTYAYNLDWTINTITFSWWRVITYSYTDWEITSWSDTIRTWTVTRTDWVITAITVTVL